MGETQLHLAAKKGDLDKVQKQLDMGADVNTSDNAGVTKFCLVLSFKVFAP